MVHCTWEGDLELRPGLRFEVCVVLTQVPFCPLKRNMPKEGQRPSRDQNCGSERNISRCYQDHPWTQPKAQLFTQIFQVSSSRKGRKSSSLLKCHCKTQILAHLPFCSRCHLSLCTAAVSVNLLGLLTRLLAHDSLSPCASNPYKATLCLKAGFPVIPQG